MYCPVFYVILHLEENAETDSAVAAYHSQWGPYSCLFLSKEYSVLSCILILV